MDKLSKYFLFLFLAWVLSCDSGSGPDGNMTRQLIYSLRFDQYHFALVKLNEDGTDFRYLSPDSISAFGPVRFSPNGRSMFFDAAYGTSSVRDIWILSKDDMKARPFVVHPAHDIYGSWDFSGERVYFQSNRTGRFSIWTCTSQGTDVHQLLPDSFLVSGFMPSPTAPLLAFVHYGSIHQGTRGRLALFDQRTETVKLVTSDSLDLNFSDLSWSPDGSRIAFVAIHRPVPPSQYYPQNLYGIDTSGTQLVQFSGPAVYLPAWSHNGRMIAFTTPDSVQIIDLTSGHLMAAVACSWSGTAPFARWSPDDRAIAYSFGDPSYVWILAIGAAAPKRLTQSTLAEFFPVWSSNW